MTITLLAPDGVPVTAMQERQAKAAQHGGGSGRRLGGRSGFRVDTPANVLTVTSSTWTLGPCAIEIDPGASTHQGMYGWALDTNETRALDPADETNPRKDIVCIQVNDSSAGDGSGSLAAPLFYIPGEASATPTAPALPPRSFLVGTITVPALGGGAPTAVRNPAVYVAAGAPLPVSSQSERDAIPDKYNGFTVQRTDLPGRPLEVFDGAVWSIIPTVQSVALTQGGDPGWVVSGVLTKTRIGSLTQVVLTARMTRAVAEELSESINKTIANVIPAGYRAAGTVDWLTNHMSPNGNIVRHVNAFIAPNGDLTIKHDTTAYKMFPGDYWTLSTAWWM